MCEKCRDTGKLPIKDYAHGFYSCDCTPQEYGTFRERNLTDFDFPCSDTFRGFYQAEPMSSENSPALPTEQVIVHRHSNMGKQDYDLLQQTARGLVHVSKALNEHMKYKKAITKPLSPGSGGLKIE